MLNDIIASINLIRNIIYRMTKFINFFHYNHMLQWNFNEKLS